MEAIARVKFIRISPKKARLVADAIRGMQVGKALNSLTFSPKKAADIFSKALNSAVANASNDSDVDVDKLFVKKVYVDAGPTLKRWRARAMGRAYQIRKRTSHITVVVADS